MERNEPKRTVGGIAYKNDGPKTPGHTEAIRSSERAPSVDLEANASQLLATVRLEEFGFRAVVVVPRSASEWLVATCLDELGRELDHVLAATRGERDAGTPEPERSSARTDGGER